MGTMSPAFYSCAVLRDKREVTGKEGEGSSGIESPGHIRTSMTTPLGPDACRTQWEWKCWASASSPPQVQQPAGDQEASQTSAAQTTSNARPPHC